MNKRENNIKSIISGYYKGDIIPRGTETQIKCTFWGTLSCPHHEECDGVHYHKNCDKWQESQR